MKTEAEVEQAYQEFREKLAGRIMVECGEGTDYPCPHTEEGNPLGAYEPCPHEDKDICLWQLEQADEILARPVAGTTLGELARFALRAGEGGKEG